ncbi:ClpX C4-type zinc finger protein [Clostridium sp.]|uniref:ClpX C4-type zinc finger protein n=1 Tax=Clostridium sp. TaxID=1506 RepID=UPI002913E024|nr:ClpX C4-type zinc finger protein [Clostridium sp.]MDU4846163.1 ClpX C4-type zinc finger protein [Clostridium sp.]
MHKCNFCGKKQTEVKIMIAGKGVDICDKCVLCCMDILTDEILNDSKRIKFDKSEVEQ